MTPPGPWIKQTPEFDTELRGLGSIQHLSFRPYRLALRNPWLSAHGGFETRAGWLIQAQSDGVSGYGDCAPLPEAGTEHPKAAERALVRWQRALRGLGLDAALRRIATTDTVTPTANWAMECAILDLGSRIAGVSLRHWLGTGQGDAIPDWIPVNGNLGAIGALDPQDLNEAGKRGYRVLKLKVGMGDPSIEMGKIRTLADTLPPGIGLRLDANGAWDKETAVRCIGMLGGLPVECLEEPLDTPDPTNLALIQGLAPFPIAVDESLPYLLTHLHPASLPVRRAVLKPTVLGGPRRTLDLAQRFSAAGIETVLTSLVESAAGLWPTAQLAALIPSPVPHGLATASWLMSDLGPAPIPDAGRIRLPDAPGSGFHPFPSGPQS